MAPEPFFWPASNQWLGQDGNWSMFQITLGSPGQTFYVVPSSTNSEVWIPVAEGCNSILPVMNNCTSTRGIGDFNGLRNVGFQTNRSTTWRQIGIYGLVSEQNLYGTAENGLYGLDQILIGTESINHTVTNLTVAGIATKDFWLGSVGLADETGGFSVIQNNTPSLISRLSQNNITPSVSYGFTAGAAYKNSPASLVFGGYDSTAVKLDNITFDIPSSNNILINLAGIVATNTLQGAATMLESSTGLTMKIDSTISQLWLPENVCDKMTQAFGLIYDSDNNFYLINATMHKKMLTLQPQLTFTLATGPSSSTTTNIVLPYAAFDLSIGLPIYNESIRYFPIRRAANETQYVLGRVFLQEAYIIVDWARTHFRVGQAQHSSAEEKNIVTISSPSNESSPDDNTVSQFAVRRGAIAGISVSAVVILVMIAAISYLWHKRRQRTVNKSISDVSADEAGTKGYQIQPDEKVMPELDGVCSSVLELHGGSEFKEAMAKDTTYELHQDSKEKLQLMSHEVFELPGSAVSQELGVKLDDEKSHSSG